MAIVAGIDEAGLGPVLGPLVVSVSVFRVPEALAERCLWRVLAGAVTRRSIRRSAALPVADSKTMHVRTDGVLHLERGVLGALRLRGIAPASLAELLRVAAPAALKPMRRYPWYAGRSLALPRQADAKDVALRANAAAEAMRRPGIGFEAIRAETVLAGEYNRLVAATRNKSVALFSLTSRLISYVFQTYANRQPTRILIDRQGGRMRYLPALQRMFEGAAIKIVEESDRRSAYHVRDGRCAAEIHFLTDGDANWLPVALASMLSKYLRELFMELLNRWWGRRVDGLRPTAGYYVDGRRFLKDIAEAISAEGIDTSVRQLTAPGSPADSRPARHRRAEAACAAGACAAPPARAAPDTSPA